MKLLEPRRLSRALTTFAVAGAILVLPTPAFAGQGFNDDTGSVHEQAIEAVSNAGITSGCNPPLATKFCPNDAVTRGQMAAFLVRGLGLTNSDPGIDFTDDNNSTFEADIEKLATAGITIGCNPPTNTKFCPDKILTRAAMATFLTRALDLPLAPPPGFTVAAGDSALVARYHVIRKQDGVDTVYVDNMQYWPRSLAKGLDIEPDPDYRQVIDSPGR